MDRPNDIASEGEVKRKFTEFWEWFESISGVPYEITGKFLSFSTNREYLCHIALTEIKSPRSTRQKLVANWMGRTRTGSLSCITKTTPASSNSPIVRRMNIQIRD